MKHTMKKIVSILMIAAMLVLCFAATVSASNASPKGEVSFVGIGDVTIVDKEGTAVEAELPEKVVNVEVPEETPVVKEEVVEKLGGDYSEYKFYGAFAVELTPEAKAVVGDGSIKDTAITVAVAGIDETNTPVIVAFDEATGEYKVVESTVKGTEITFNATVGSETLHYAIVYVPSETSPSTGVATWALVAVLAVAVVGAAFAGKKAFAK